MQPLAILLILKKDRGVQEIDVRVAVLLLKFYRRVMCVQDVYELLERILPVTPCAYDVIYKVQIKHRL